MTKQTKGLTLDAGCGDGVLSKYLRSCIFLDLSLIALKKFRGRKRQRILASVENMPFKPNIFETVIASEVIEHTDKPKNFIMETHRILRKGGKFLFSFPWHDKSRSHKFKTVNGKMLRDWLIPPFKSFHVLIKSPRGIVMSVKT